MAPDYELDFLLGQSSEFDSEAQAAEVRRAYQASTRKCNDKGSANYFLWLCKAIVRHLKKRPKPLKFDDKAVAAISATLCSGDSTQEKSTILLDLLSVLQHDRDEFGLETLMIAEQGNWNEVPLL